MVMYEGAQRLHWTQRVALVRHNLHSARRMGDFGFFKSLQAHAVIEGTDHVALLQQVLGDNADSILSTLDNLNAGIAYVHQDAFKAVYDSAKSGIHADDNSLSSRRSLLRVDICQQRDMADHAIDKTTNSAINLIEAQPLRCQDAVANAWITGTTIIADAVCVCLAEMDRLEENLDDFIRLEYSWNSTQSSVDAAISALRGIFSLMATISPPSNFTSPSTRNLSVSSAGYDPGQAAHANGGTAASRARNSSTASAFNMIKRAFSVSVPHPSKAGIPRLSLPEEGPHDFRSNMSNACPTKMSSFGDNPPTIMATIPPTPAVTEESINPFKENPDYFAFDMGKQNGSASKQNDEGDLMQM
jgi:hypothetical protein